MYRVKSYILFIIDTQMKNLQIIQMILVYVKSECLSSDLSCNYGDVEELVIMVNILSNQINL